jgi:hypothetical protein
MAADERKRLKRQIELICLADKGYKRFKMPKKSFNEIERDRDQTARIDHWFALAAVLQPKGEEMPE